MSFVLCAAMLLSGAVCANADDYVGETENCGAIDGEELTRRIEEYMQANNISKSGYSVGYCYTATGDKWFYNADEWYYSASLFKVPLMMLFAEKVYEGELTQDTVLYGQDLTTAEEKILVNSITSDAIVMMGYFGSETECRTSYRKYSDLPDDYFISDYYTSNHFTARYMTDVMTTLCKNDEQFPNIIDCLERAQPDEYFNLTVGKEYEVAQKYGSYEYLHHTAGIIYTPNPIVVVVMTDGKALYQDIISETAQILTDYTLELDARLEAERLEAEAQAKAEAEAEAERLKREEEARLAAEAAETPLTTEPPVQDVQEPEEKTLASERIIGVVLAVSALIILVSATVVRGIKRRKKHKKQEI